VTLTHSAETVCATESESKAELSAKNRNRKSIVSGPKPSASLMPACQGSQVTVPGCRRRQRSQLPRLSLHSQSVHSEANDYLRLAHSLPPQLKLCTLLSATTVFTNCSTPKLKVHRMWYDCFWLKPNVRWKCPFVHIQHRNRSRSTPKLKVHRMWYDCFWLKPNVRWKCPFVHIQHRNRSRNSVDL